MDFTPPENLAISEINNRQAEAERTKSEVSGLLAELEDSVDTYSAEKLSEIKEAFEAAKVAAARAGEDDAAIDGIQFAIDVYSALVDVSESLDLTSKSFLELERLQGVSTNLQHIMDDAFTDAVSEKSKEQFQET